ncbi:Appr-1-p processing protein [Candidatus Falkowbacteria bacterium CG_4_10_14_0_2_um_filter_36_22]|nr:MAG: Appr-1-p processing protein [Candidatus Desantisbacteria bacterium CG02_land_8_20_14_3_00_49_13]PJA11276.1 MAG: Appr-1-p processing protein [Candidatus Falkowbacteria bacterium CG_4_10_14_0_2_um_filter_36_22]
MVEVKIVIGDIFKSKAQTLVNTVNCVGVMGKGLALEFKNRFPDMFKDYYIRCQNKEVYLEKPYLFKRLILPWILIFPTKEHWRSTSNISDIEKGLQYLGSMYKEWGITSIAVPPLGCGLGELEWNIVGKILYRSLSALEIPVELYAPYGTPKDELNPKFLEEPSQAQLIEMNKHPRSRITPDFIPLIEVLKKLEEIPYHWSVGRITFQKIAYFGTFMGLKTGLEYKRGSFGPFSSQLKTELTKLVNNGLIEEEHIGSMFRIKPGKTYEDARKVYKEEIEKAEPIINELVDLFCRLNTAQAEIAATIHFAKNTMKTEPGVKISEEDVLNEVMLWKQKHKPSYNVAEVAKAIRNLAIHGRLDVEASERISKIAEDELEV